MWDIIHDRTHMRGDLPFDPFMIKQRMPFFLYSLEELRCDLTAFRESVKIERQLRTRADAGEFLTARDYIPHISFQWVESTSARWRAETLHESPVAGGLIAAPAGPFAEPRPPLSRT